MAPQGTQSQKKSDVRIAHVMPTRADGTAWEMSRRTVSALADANISQLVISGEAIETLPEGVETYTPSSAYWPKLWRRLVGRRAVRRFEATCLCSWGAKDDIAGMQGVPTLYFRRTVDQPTPGLSPIDRVIVPTDVLRDDLKARNIPVDVLQVIPDVPLTSVVSAIDRKTYFTPANAPLVLVSGDWRLGQGGIEALLEGVERVAGCYIWFIGGGPEKDALVEAAREIGVKPRLRLIDWPDDLAAHYCAVDLVLNPYGRDMTHRPVLDAWAQGRAIVATDAKGPGLLISHRETGLLVPPGEPRQLTEAVRKLLEDPERRSRLIDAGHQALKAQPGPQDVITQLIDLAASLGAPAKSR